MNYVFPTIDNLDEILDLIKDKKEFHTRVDEENQCTSVSYHLAFNETFPPVIDRPTALLRELRGIIFDNKTRKVLSRRYHKFFNVGEKEETLFANLPISRHTILLDKLDGSMVTPLFCQGQNLRWATIQGVTQLSPLMENFVKDREAYGKIATSMFRHGITPIFEYCSNNQRIILDYPKEDLVLTALRYNDSGEYLPYQELKLIARQYGVSYIQMYPFDYSDIENIQKTIWNQKDIEGAIMRFPNGHMVKLKTQFYLSASKALEGLIFEKDIVRMILEGKVDDVKPYLSSHMIQRLDDFSHLMMNAIEENAKVIHQNYQEALISTNSKKEFFFFVQEKFDRKYQTMLLKVYDGLISIRQIVDMITQEIINNSGTQTRLNEKKYLYNNLNWNQD